MKLLKLGDWLYLIIYKWYTLHGQYGKWQVVKGGREREKDEDGQASHNLTLPLPFLTSLSITFNLCMSCGVKPSAWSMLDKCSTTQLHLQSGHHWLVSLSASLVVTCTQNTNPSSPSTTGVTTWHLVINTVHAMKDILLLIYWLLLYLQTRFLATFLPILCM